MIHIDERELYDSIARLNDVQFPEATVNDFANKAIGELKEVQSAPKSKRLGEHADSLICVLAGAAKDGWTYAQLIGAAQTKTDVNHVRKFIRLEDGTYQHIESE